MDDININNFWRKVYSIHMDTERLMPEIISSLILTHPHLINQYDTEGTNLIATPIRLGLIEQVRALVQLGVNIYEPVFNLPKYHDMNAIKWAHVIYDSFLNNPGHAILTQRSKQILDFLSEKKLLDDIEHEQEKLNSIINIQNEKDTIKNSKI